MRQKKKRLSSKKRRFNKLLTSTPKRDDAPLALRDLQIQSVKKILKSKESLSRGQKKRLKKKEKFINQEVL